VDLGVTWLLTTAALPVRLLLPLLRRPVSFRGFVALVAAFLAVVLLVSMPLLSAELRGDEAERRRDVLTVVALIGGSVIAIAYQRRSAEVGRVRDWYAQWLESAQGALDWWSLKEAELQLRGLLKGATEPGYVTALQERLADTLKEAATAGTRASSRMIAISRQVIPVSLRIHRRALAVVEVASEMRERRPSTVDEASAEMDRLLRAIERVNREFERWLRS
jgi:hypothetical protein